MKTSEKFLNVNITGIGTYLPANKVGNDYYIKHFKEKGIDITQLLESIGRKYRYISTDLNETTITMGAEAAKRALENANVKPEELDIIVFASDTPEYTTPSNALEIHSALGAKNAKVVYDVNANCLGAVIALDQVSRMLKTNSRYKKALVVGSVLISSVARKDDFLTYATFGDSASAVVLEAVLEDKQRGIMDSIYYADSSQHDSSHNPTIGFSKFFRTDIIDKEQAKWTSNPVDSKEYPHVWEGMVKELLQSNNLKVDDINFFIFSQFVESLITNTLELLDVKNMEDKYNFVSKEVGYTGVNCEIFALADALKNNKLKENSNLVLSAAGVGFATMVLYYKF